MALTSLFTAVSGMNANSIALSVIGDNIANMNTTGFKSSRTSFGDILSSQMGESQVGRGVLTTAVTPQFNQGTFENTANVLDMAVDGDGLFIMTDNAGTYYSRAGQFDMDSNGYVVNPSNQRLQGFLYSATGATTSGLGDINISALNSPPTATNNMTISANLDSRETIPPAFAVGNASATSNFSSSITVYDSLGNGHIVDVYFRKSVEAPAGNTWEWFGVVGGNDSLSGATEVQASGTMTFTNNGALNTESAETYPLASGGFDFTGGAASGQVIDFDFGTSIVTDAGSGLDGTTQFGSPSATIFQSQDGYASGSLKSITVAQDGTITGIFTNGQTRAIAQVALAKFAAPANLQKMGKNLYAEATDSGQPVISIPGTSGTGTVLSNTLEQSNVDLAEEFVRLIMSQRGFQANSRMISTSDELMMELVNLKR